MEFRKKQIKAERSGVDLEWRYNAKDEIWRLRQGEGNRDCIDEVTGLVCIFASQNAHCCPFFSESAGGETRLHFDFFEIKMNGLLGLALAVNSTPDCWILFFDPSSGQIKKKQMQMHLLLFYGAGDEARTRYLHLGKVALYRMSYTRNEHDIL